MLAALAIVLVGIFGLLASVHVYWALGGRIARIAAVPEIGGKPSFQPSAVATFAMACALFACAALVAAVAGFIEVPRSPAFIQWCAYALASVLLCERSVISGL